MLRNQFSNYFSSLIFITAISTIIIVSLVLVSYFSEISVMIFTRDPAAVAVLPYYTGYFSQLGGVFWMFSAGTALFTASIITNEFRKFLLFSGFFTLFLGIDDIFMIRDGLLAHIGLKENIFYGLYAILTFIYFVGFYKTILKTPFILLLLTYGTFTLSVLNDSISTPGIHPYVFEDGFKIIGIISWMVFHFVLGRNLLKESINKNSLKPTKNKSQKNSTRILKESF